MLGVSPILGYCLIISLGGAVVGIDIGIIASVLSQPSFRAYMFPPSTPNVSSLIGALVSTTAAGMALGCLSGGLFMERLGRRWSTILSTIFTVVGTVMQVAANGVALLICGRVVAGIAVGILRATIPVYISELAPPKQRSRFIGTFGLQIAIGYLLAGWIGYATSFASGNITWRLALAMQFPVAIVLIAAGFFLPESPRWLAQRERYEDMNRTLRLLYRNEDESFYTELHQDIAGQIQLEAQRRGTTTTGHAVIELFNQRNIGRTAIAILVLQVPGLSGTLVIQQYQSILYQSLNFTGERALLITAIYGFMGVIGGITNLVGIADRWPRVRTMWVGCLALATLLGVLMALSKFQSDGANENVARAGVAFIFIYSATFAVFIGNTLYTIGPEYFPLHLRGYGLSVAEFFQGVTQIWMSQVSPLAFEKIKWRYYSVFIACLVVLATIYKLFLKETLHVPLEQIAAQFGDETIGDRKNKLTAEGDIEKAAEEVENTAAPKKF